MWCRRDYDYRTLFWLVVVLALGISLAAAYADHLFLTTPPRD